MALFRIVWEYTALVMMIFTSPVNIIMTHAVYSHTTLNAIQYYIILKQAFKLHLVHELPTAFRVNEISLSSHKNDIFWY